MKALKLIVSVLGWFLAMLLICNILLLIILPSLDFLLGKFLEKVYEIHYFILLITYLLIAILVVIFRHYNKANKIWFKSAQDYLSTHPFQEAIIAGVIGSAIIGYILR